LGGGSNCRTMSKSQHFTALALARAVSRTFAAACCPNAGALGGCWKCPRPGCWPCNGATPEAVLQRLHQQGGLDFLRCQCLGLPCGGEPGAQSVALDPYAPRPSRRWARTSRCTRPGSRVPRPM